MPLIATNQSALRTGAPTLTSRQKSQSSGSEDPLLRDPCRTDADELADRSVDQPRRVVVSVAAPWAIDEHEVLAAELRAPASEARPVRKGPQTRAALFLDRRRDGGFGPGPR